MDLNLEILIIWRKQIKICLWELLTQNKLLSKNIFLQLYQDLHDYTSILPFLMKNLYVIILCILNSFISFNLAPYA